MIPPLFVMLPSISLFAASKVCAFNIKSPPPTSLNALIIAPLFKIKLSKTAVEFVPDFCKYHLKPLESEILRSGRFLVSKICAFSPLFTLPL